ARIAPALCGIATIPLLWIAGSAIGRERQIAYAVLPLIAVSPLAVYYSREARPYALVVLLAAALIAALLESKFGLFVALLVVAFSSGAMIAPVIAGVAAAATVKGHRWWLSAAACVLLLTTCYQPGRYPAQIPVETHSATDLRRVLDSFSVVAV